MSYEPKPFRHISVLRDEVVAALVPRPGAGGTYVDGTVGGGGHARAVLAAAGSEARLLALDADPAAIAAARSALAEFGDAAVLVQSNFAYLLSVARAYGFDPVDGVLIDLGVSSHQLDTAERGFSFQFDAPLDMRFDPRQPTTAADLVNELGDGELADLIFRYGEEPASRRIARAIVAARPVQTTGQLAAIVARVVRRPDRIHPATRTFQALRIAVNQELEVLAAVLEQAVELLRPEGRLAAISFHSLEDRVVKDYFRQQAAACLCPPRTPVCICGHTPRLRLITRKPITAGEAELQANPRSRSAKLRVAERL